jgi:hypothetical protein
MVQVVKRASKLALLQGWVAKKKYARKQFEAYADLDK